MPAGGVGTEPRLSGSEKVAVLLLTLDDETAQELMKQLPAAVLQRVASHAGMLREVPDDVIFAIKNEFCSAMRNASALELGNSRDVIRELLSGFMTPEEVEKITLNLDTEDPDQNEGLETLKWMAPETISAFLRNEHPQTIALVLAHLEPSQAAQVLARLKPVVQSEVIMRLSTLDRVPPLVLHDLNQVLKEELISSASTSMETLGGAAAAAEIMNNIDKQSETTIFEAVEDVNPSLVEEIRELMFTFEDLVTIDNRGIQELTKQISNDQLVIALRTATDDVKRKFLENISQRAAQMIQEELELMGPIKISDVEQAQQEIVKIARRLEDEGKIVLAGKGGGETLV